MKNLIALALFVSQYSIAYGEPLQISDKSVFAVLTLKKGLASGFAHNHVVVAQNWNSHVDYDKSKKILNTFEISIPVDSLEIDDPNSQDNLFPLLKEYIPGKEKFVHLDATDRKKVKENMLSESQLNAKSEKTISAKVLELQKIYNKANDLDSHFNAKIQISIRGTTNIYDTTVKLTENDGLIFANSVIKLKFTDFGIKPYKAFAGLVGNKDEFYLFANIIAK